MKLPESTLVGTHFTEQDTIRRLKIYRKLNEPNTGVEKLEDFFVENNVEIHHLDIGPSLESAL